MRKKIKFNYQEFVNRNWGYIEKPLQKKIRKSRLFFAGCGLGSVIAEAAVRLGFSQFILADGDQVELSNLNRQSFNLSHLGTNKASALSSLLRNINPEIKVEVIPRFIEVEDVPALSEESDFVINTVDIGDVYFELVRRGQQKKGHVLLPFNTGFGSIVLIFNRNTKCLDEVMEQKTFKDEIGFYEKLLKVLTLGNFPEEISEKLLKIFSEVKKKGTFPQTRIGAEIASSLVVTSLVRILSGREVPLAPDFLLHDIHP
ncbi:MAG: ThiF family adenylyltransferase [Nitrospirae bacterium]|nr:ThiF family adenylyltransferase [Nitrospirota bacterium]MBI3605794.1 ThiF family adenylyltransferase [Nitrospirota bacterium]